MKKTIDISGMSCGHCVHAVREALSSVAHIQIEDVAIGKAVIQAEPSALDEDIRAAIEDEGYAVTGIQQQAD